MKTIVAVSFAGLLALSACSSSSDDATPATPLPTASPTAAEVIGPIIVGADQTEVEATVGRTIVFDVGPKPARWDISTDNSAVVSVSKGGKKDGATFNPGALALAAGEATVTLEDTKGMDALVYTITVTE